MKKWGGGGKAKWRIFWHRNDHVTVLNTELHIDLTGAFWEDNTQVVPRCSSRGVGLYHVLSRPALWTAECGGWGVGGTQLESDALHFNQKSSMSLSYLALETGQSRAAVSCFNTLLAVAALQISRPLFLSSVRLPQTAFSPSRSVAPAHRERLRERRRGQNVFAGRETATCVSPGVKGKVGVAAVPAQTRSLSLLWAQRR